MFIGPLEHITYCLISAEPDEIYDKRRGLTYQQAVDRYNRRFKAADKNGDKKLDKEEFADMLNPGEESYQCRNQP